MSDPRVEDIRKLLNKVPVLRGNSIYFAEITNLEVEYLLQKIDSLEQALSGRTVSCDNCNESAKKVQELKKEIEKRNLDHQKKNERKRKWYTEYYSRNPGKRLILSRRQSEKRRGNLTYRKYKRDKDKILNKKPRYKEISRELKKKYNLRNPSRRIAHNAINNAIKSGKIIRPEKCFRCGDLDRKNEFGRHTIHAHHHDYSKPFDVIWICRKCHLIEHGNLIHEDKALELKEEE